jgi:predicted 2-oxoglutarate/Fe(II)-dependent dioxygenase YbiX
MKAHIDNPDGWGDRDVASIVYLNSAEQWQGGVFRMTNTDFELQPTAGDLLIFDCIGEEARHEVTPVTNGVRYTFSCWYQKNS